MCACGCFFLAVVAAGLAFTALHHMWLLFVLILLASAISGWFGRKAAGWRPPPKK
jgi:membrane protein implicated in regulation of membrane protease activity